VLQDLAYEVMFDIPSVPDSAVTGEVTVYFILREAGEPLVLDFRAPADHVLDVKLDGAPVEYALVPDHIVIPAAALTAGEHRVTTAFRSTDAALNRNEDFLYALFVPDRASTAFPVFEQPDLKARFTVELAVPAAWKALSNGALVTRDSTRGDRHTLAFARTEPLSTYLLAFAAGVMQEERAERDGRIFTMYHRETDSAKVARNRDAILDLHATALRWLEEYTGIAYPFGKFDFLAVPAFQFGGMEHPGAIWYRSGGVFLDETATRNQELGRASLIAHETAHMWFGDLVTMRWFNDVWMKEVFANFMAAKIVNPSFPDIDHELRFLLAHHPAAYGVDRTAGTHAIRQQLDNLNEAGSLYGAIIYQKAPVVMRQLEVIAGEEPFRDGLREYLRDYSYGNATWRDLVAILDRRTPQDLSSWSRVWVEESGRPRIHAEVDIAAGRIRALSLRQIDPAGSGRVWPQRVDMLLAWPDSSRTVPVVSDAPVVHVDVAGLTADGVASLPAPRYVLPDGRGLGYAHFVLDAATRRFLLDSLASVSAPVARGSATLALHDAMLAGEVAPAALLESLMTAVAVEREQLLTARYLGTISSVFWRFLTPPARADIAPRLEELLWRGLNDAADASMKASWFAALRDVALTEASVERLHAVWALADSIPGLPLAERDYTALAHELALREVPQWREILAQQLDRIDNPDRRARFSFIMPALSAEPAVRDSFFNSLADVRNRSHEPWVLDGLAAINHPLRAARAQRYIRPALELLPEIQRTGDIFFPARWLDATLGGHNTPAAATIVRDFLDRQRDYPSRLRAKILQSADPLFRAATMVEPDEVQAGVR
jgi:aminopeptidase N